MSCERASLARLCPKSVVLDLGVPTQCKMQDGFNLVYIEKMVLTTCQQLPVPGPGLPFPQTGRCSLRISCSACKRRVLLDAKTIFFRCFCFTCVQRRYLQSDTLPIPEDHYVNLLYNLQLKKNKKWCDLRVKMVA